MEQNLIHFVLNIITIIVIIYNSMNYKYIYVLYIVYNGNL
jgi:hypothetical protein